jgi:molybdenum cofactor biosynthesis protein B
MAGIDETQDFTPINIAVLTVSDTRTRADDTSGDILEARVLAAGHKLADRQILRDDISAVRMQVLDWVNQPDIDAVITTGGTGLTGRDITPEAVTPLFDKTIDGFSAVFHMHSYQKIGLSTMQSRACAGLADTTFIFCLPGSNGAVKDGWEIIGAQLDSRYRPCNFVQIMPRLNEK